MQLKTPFSQRTVIQNITVSLPTKGVCFRLTFKWAACSLVGGLFNTSPNADKTAAKHCEYRAGTLKEEKRLSGDFSAPEALERYTKIDWDASRRYLNLWGEKFTDANKMVFRNVYVEDQSIDSIREYLQNRPNLGTAAVMAGFYGHRADGKAAWGHVVAFCTRGGPTADGASFFDSNFGVFEFDENEDKGRAIMSHIKSRYLGDGRRIEDFNTIVLKTK